MSDAISEEKKRAITTFLNAKGGLTVDVPPLPDQADWREPYLTRTRVLAEVYDQAFGKIKSQARSQLSDPVRKPEHVYHQTHPNFCSISLPELSV